MAAIKPAATGMGDLKSSENSTAIATKRQLAQDANPFKPAKYAERQNPMTNIQGDGREVLKAATTKLPDRELTNRAGRGSYPSGKSVSVRTVRQVTRRTVPRGGGR